MLINKNYIVLPVTYRMASKKLKFTENGKLIFDMDVCLDMKSPRALAYYDIKRFRGKDLDITVDPEIGFVPVLVDEPDETNLYHEKYRPEVHFTAKFGWLNDPNGLVKVGDTYHLFFQHNPLLWRWGNMHWGHAVSTDLFHWKELDHALFPDEMGTMYSGSAIIDRDNVTGLGDGKTPPVIFFYTAASQNNIISEDKKYTQCLAYSLDGGMTLHKYKNNPIIDHIEACNRDPKVVWCEPIGKFLMSLYLNDNRYTLLSSADLIHWERFQDLSIENDSECPDMFPIRADDGRDLWCIYGASTRYLVGEFREGKFVPIQGVETLRNSDWGYAGQTYSDMPDGRRILVLWECLDMGTDPICGQMSLPLDLKLKNCDGKYLLTASPVEEIKGLRKEVIGKTVSVSGKEQVTFQKLGDNACDLTLRFKYQTGKKFFVSLFGAFFTVDMEKNEIWLHDRHEPISRTAEGNCDIRIVIDRCTAEVFTDGGLYPMALENIADLNIDTMVVSGDVTDLSVEYASLNSVWED